MAKDQEGDSKQNDGSERAGKGNFANDPQRASEAGKKGGQQSHQGSSNEKSDRQQSGDTNSGKGSGNFADDPERASEAGRKGGQHSHGGSSK